MKEDEFLKKYGNREVTIDFVNENGNVVYRGLSFNEDGNLDTISLTIYSDDIYYSIFNTELVSDLFRKCTEVNYTYSEV